MTNAGRPTKYKPEYDQALIDYFNKDVVEEIVETIEGKNWSKTTTRKEATFFPTLEGFANSIGVNGDTIVEWASARYPEDYTDKKLAGKLKHPGFSAAYTRAKGIQKDLTIRYGITGKLDSRFAIFFATNNLNMVSAKEENETHITVTTRKHRGSD